MKEKATACGKEWKGASRWAYCLFLILVVYYMFAGNHADAVNNLCIALIFDPFDQAKAWKERPLYHRLWLLTHLALVLAGFACLVYTNSFS